MSSPKKNFAIVGSSVVLLVAVVAVVAVTVSSAGNQTSDVDPSTATATSPDKLSTSSKSIQSICQPTDYRDTCESALNEVAGNTTDPKELIQHAFNVTISRLYNALNHSKVLQDAAKDPSTSAALDSCRDLLDLAVGDLRASLDKLVGIDLSQVGQAVSDLQTWLAAAFSYQDTCLDGFDDATSPAAEGMKKALNSSMELTSNANVMIDQAKKLFKDLDLSSLLGGRKLLSSSSAEGERFPSWLSAAKRKLLTVPLFELAPSVTVAQDGTGNFKTVTEAIEAVPLKSKKPFVIYIKAGTYKEQILIEKKKPNVVLVGDGPTKTIITYNSNYGIDGTKTWKTATVGVQGHNFVARDIGFVNSAGPQGHQAVALRINSDFAVVYNCRMDGYQDTMYVQNYRQFYRDCTISGTIDFIFGDGRVIFQNCQILVRQPEPTQQNMITAQGRKDKHMITGVVLHNCTILPDPEFAPKAGQFRTFLGRPWKPFAKAVFIQNYIDGFISPDGYTPWIDGLTMSPVNFETSYFAEFGNRGPGADVSKRVSWPSIQKLDADDAEEYTPDQFFHGYMWLPAIGVPYIPELVPNSDA